MGALVSLAWPLAVCAEDQPTAATQRIEIRSDASAQRRADVAGRQVVPRDDLLRFGDTRLSEALQKVPGVTVDVRGQQTELKLGGLGEGYTQILLNGEPLPRGTALDSIALDSIERVEILRGASVQSSQAIAGSINIVTRQPASLFARDVKLQGATRGGHAQASATVNLSDRIGRATWGLGLVASYEDQVWPATFLQERFERTADGTVLTQRTRTDKREYDRTDAFSINPRLAWKRDDDDGSQWQFSTDHSLRVSQSHGGVADERSALAGPPPAEQSSVLSLNYRRLFWRGRLQAIRRSADGARTEVSLNMTHSSRDQRAGLVGYDFTPRLVHDGTIDGLALDESAVLKASYKRPLAEEHRVDVGAELERARRKENRSQTERFLPGGLPPEDFDERFATRVQRSAVYAQDEWAPSSAVTLQAGIRLEHLDSVSQGNGFETVRQSHRLVGPLLRLSIEPQGGLGTFKVGLSRGFKLPLPRDVMPRRYVPIEVSPTAPAFAGNPDLRPERAWSLDASWQRRLQAMRGEMSLSASFRRIDDVMLDRLIEQPTVLSAPWLLQRFNGGRAWAAGLEGELRGEAGTPLFAGQPLRWQASLSLARSRLLDVPGAHPALSGQAAWQVKGSLTQVVAPGWTVQFGVDARGAAVADLPSARSIDTAPQHSLNAGLVWELRKRQSFRFSLSDLAASDNVDLKRVRVGESGIPVLYQATEAWHRQLLLRVSFESDF